MAKSFVTFVLDSLMAHCE